MKRTLALILLSAVSVLAQGAHITQNPWVSSRQGNPVAGASIAVCQGLATTAASVTSNLAVFTMASNPSTAGFVAGMTVQVSGFTGADTYFNAGTLANGALTNGLPILSVTPTTVTVSLVHANANATTNGSLVQFGNSVTSCAGLATIYTDASLATTTTNPFLSDSLGNYDASVPTGTYYVQVYGSGVTTTLRQIIVPGVPNGTFPGSLIQKGTPIFDIRAAPYNGACDGVTDNTTPFHLALTDALTSAGSTIFFPAGACLFNSKPDSISNGVKLLGQGWSTNQVVGTSLIRNYSDATTNGFITFDGNFGTAKGTGGGIDDMTIGPAVGTTGGYLLKFTSTPGCVVGTDCDNHRASDTKITNVFLGNGNGGTEACGLYIDGSNNTTGGSQGIRIVNVNNLRVSSSTTADCSVYANNVAHLFLNNVEIDTGFGSTPGITITGVGAAPNAAASANVYFSNMELVGDLVIDSASGVQTSGSVLVNGTTSMSANTANSILLGRFATAPTNSSTTSTWATTSGSTPLMVQGLCATSTGVCTGAKGEIFAVNSTTTGVIGMGSDHNVTFNRFASNKVGLVGAMLCATVTCSSGMNAGDMQAAQSATAGAFWLGTDSLSYFARNAAGDVRVPQNFSFLSGTAFAGTLTAPFTASRTYTFPDGPASPAMTVNFTTAGATTSDILAVQGMTASGHCGVSASNALAATGQAAGTTWLDTPGANVITLHHTATNGQVFTVVCSSI